MLPPWNLSIKQTANMAMAEIMKVCLPLNPKNHSPEDFADFNNCFHSGLPEGKIVIEAHISFGELLILILRGKIVILGMIEARREFDLSVNG